MATARVTLYCTWRPSDLATGLHGQAIQKLKFGTFLTPVAMLSVNSESLHTEQITNVLVQRAAINSLTTV